jgi:hypothetical protein
MFSGYVPPGSPDFLPGMTQTIPGCIPPGIFNQSRKKIKTKRAYLKIIREDNIQVIIRPHIFIYIAN